VSEFVLSRLYFLSSRESHVVSITRKPRWCYIQDESTLAW